MFHFKAAKIMKEKINCKKQNFNKETNVKQPSEIPVETNNEKSEELNQSQTNANLRTPDLREFRQPGIKKSAETISSSRFILSCPDEWIYLVVDNHGISGIKDKVSLVLASVLAALGSIILIVCSRNCRMQTKLKTIRGFQICSTKKQIYEAINSVGCCICEQNEDFDLTKNEFSQCQENITDIKQLMLIIVSHVSKTCCDKITALVYNVEYGEGSIFRTKEDAEETARILMQDSKISKTSVFLTSMKDPVGKAFGDSVEIIEIINCLKGNGPSDIVQFTCAFGSELLQQIRNTNKEDGTTMILNALKNGTALQKFQSIIIRQGVLPEVAFELCYRNASFFLPKTWYQTDIVHQGECGFVQKLNLLVFSNVYEKVLMQDKQHPGAGLVLIKSVEEKIKKGEIWIKINHQKGKITREMQALLKNVLIVGKFQTKRVLNDERLIHTIDKLNFIEGSY